ncbi:PAXIP1-associated glutamate-rich protein 1 [Columba livia]|uniref:PAXIP1-associated glutamate-rich protein 1 n=1 Tax=Columba livia TaxID=8932 RepID=UPI0031BA217C
MDADPAPGPAPSDAHWSAAAANWATDDADWCVPRSDEEEEEEEGGGWAPAPPEIRRLLELIAQRGTLELRRPARPRRPPTPLREAAPACESSEEPPQERPDKPPVVPQFEFEDEPVAPQRPLIDRRRAHGAGRVARRAALDKVQIWADLGRFGAGRVARRAALDKVLWDMKRHQALEQQILRTGLDLFPPGARARTT